MRQLLPFYAHLTPRLPRLFPAHITRDYSRRVYPRYVFPPGTVKPPRAGPYKNQSQGGLAHDIRDPIGGWQPKRSAKPQEQL